MTEAAQQQTTENPGAGADDAAKAAANDTAKKEGAGAEGAGDPAKEETTVQLYKPEGIAEHLLGANDQETIDKLNKAYKGAREELGKKGNKAPEKADDYTLTLPDDLKDKVIKTGEDGKDPVFEALKPALHKAGISNEMASELATELYKAVGAYAAQQAENAPKDPDPADMEYKALGGKEKAQGLVDAANAWINGVKETAGLDDADVKELQYLTMHSQGLKVLNKLRALTSEKPIPADFGQGDPNRLVTQVEIDEMMNDDRWRSGDAAWHELVREKIKQKQLQSKGQK